MHDSYVDGFCLKLENILDREKIKEVANLLYIYSIDYEIKPIKNNIIVSEYKLPNAYYIYMAAKEQDGKMTKKSREQYRMCLEKIIILFLYALK